MIVSLRQACVGLFGETHRPGREELDVTMA